MGLRRRQTNITKQYMTDVAHSHLRPPTKPKTSILIRLCGNVEAIKQGIIRRNQFATHPPLASNLL